MTIAERIYTKIKEYPSIVLFGHKDPDGDCVGSTRGLKHLLQSLFPDKRVLVSGTRPSSLPAFLEEGDEVDEKTIKESLGILLDHSDTERSEDRRSSLAKEIVIIDHHIPGTKDRDKLSYRIVDAPSCTYVLSLFLEELHLDYDEECAKAFFLGLVTDSDTFRLDARKETFEAAMKFASKIKDPSQILKEVNKPSESKLKFLSFLYTHYRFTRNACYCVIRKEDYLPLGLRQNDISNEVSKILGLDGKEFAVFFVEKEDGGIRVEYRANTTGDVEKIARHFGGGGHRNASGSPLSSLSQVKDVLSYLEKEEEKE